MRFVYNIFFLFLIAGTLLMSCKKKDNPSPMIDIQQPLSGSNYSPGDTIYINAIISDDQPLSSVSIKLLNSGYIAVDHLESTKISGTTYHLSYAYIIQNIQLSSGIYYITLSVTDGTNDENNYRTISILELPRVRKAVYVITQQDTTRFEVSKIDSSGSLNSLFNVTGDYVTSAINSQSQQLLTLGKYTSGFNQFETKTNTVSFNIKPYNFPLPSFQNLFFNNGLTFISYYDGHIKGFDPTGQSHFYSGDNSFYVPDALCVNDKYVFAEGYYSSTKQNKIIVLYKSSGAERQGYSVSFDIVSMISIDDIHIMIFGNENGDGKILTYDVLLNGTNLLQTRSGILFYKAIIIDSDNYALATDKGLYRYTKSTNNFLPVDLSEPIYTLEYDDVNGIVFAGCGKRIKEYVFPSSSVSNTITTADSVVDVKVLYNK